MCGIIGYIGDRNIVETLIGGLKKLEYRGYDSAGICVKEKDGLVVVKKKGRVEELEKEINPNSFLGHIGIAHTRWATHGQPNEINAHPHLDCKGEIAVVHNGIIENYHALKEFLEKEVAKLGKLEDKKLKSLAEKSKEEKMEVETKTDQMTKQKYWVT